jgi:hypothetical protein
MVLRLLTIGADHFKGGGSEEDVLLPMGRTSIRGFAFPALGEPNAQLHVNYRKDWRIPCRPGGLTTKGLGALF